MRFRRWAPVGGTPRWWPHNWTRRWPIRPPPSALAELDAILIGGGPMPARIAERAAAAGISLVRTYGMSETAGGCVYDGVPLDGVRIRVDLDGRIALGGATLAKGYRNPPETDPFAEPGWFVTDDVGALDDSGTLRILGRTDDAISTGGLTVFPQLVENALASHPAGCRLRGLRCARRSARPTRRRRRRCRGRLHTTDAVRIANPRQDDAGSDGRTPRGAHRRRAATTRDRQGRSQEAGRAVRSLS